MVKFTCQAEIRRPLTVEHVAIPARTKEGRQLPAMEFDKRYYNAEVDGEAVLLRLNDQALNSGLCPTDLGKGDMVTVHFCAVEIEGEISQIQTCAIVRPSKK